MRRLKVLLVAIAFSLVPAGLLLSAAGASEVRAERQAQAAQAPEDSPLSIAGAVVGSAGAIAMAVGGSSVAARLMRGVQSG